MNEEKYPAWGKTERLGNLFMTITEKLDGTNALVEIVQAEPEPTHCLALFETETNGLLGIRAGSRTRWLKPSGKEDNFGFAAWVVEHAAELVKLGVGKHYGEWWGLGIQRRYNQTRKRLSLFNTHRPPESLPPCVEQVPVLYKGPADFGAIDRAMTLLERDGSVAVAEWKEPEGIIVEVAGARYKRTFDDRHKYQQETPK